MTLQDFSLTAFTILNGGRIAAYFPQMICVCRDRTGASSVSTTTWAMFCSANLATVFYALTTGDRIVAGVFGLNAIACTVILALIIRKRMTYASSKSHGADHGHSRQMPASRQFTLAGLWARLRLAAEDRIAARHAGDRWSDTVEREINTDWRDYRCGRLH
jgi:hypothetical protein